MRRSVHRVRPWVRLSGAAARALRGAALVAWCGLGLGCAAGLQPLDERVVPPYAKLLQSDNELPSTLYRLPGAAPPGDGPERWIYAREIASRSAEASARPVLVLLNGVFSDGGTWRFTTAPLAEHFDLLVIDLPGTGRSCPDDPDGLPESAFTLAWIGEHVWSALASWQRIQASPRPMVLVGHSLAGAVILRMLGNPRLRGDSARERALTRGAVLIGSADVGTRAWSPVLVGLAKLTDVEVSIGGALGVLAAQVEEGVIKSVQHPERTALNGEVQRMIEALEDRDRRRASQLMLRRIRPIDDDDEPIWAAARELSSDHARVDAPVLLLWGRHDDILPLAATGEKLQSEIPGSRLVVIDDARHSVHQEEPFATAREIIRFVDAQASELPASR